MIDIKFIGYVFPDLVCEVEPFQLRLFAKATGETEPLYLDEAAAKVQGYPSIPAGPTFAFSISTNPADPLDLVSPLGLDIERILHGSQTFRYHKPICARDRVRATRRIANITAKKGGALEFIAYDIRYLSEEDNELLCEAELVLVYRNPDVTA